jgi:enoyl-CoA hydratase/carnithine racemase
VDDDAVRVELRADALWISLNRPAAMNALTPRMLGRLMPPRAGGGRSGGAQRRRHRTGTAFCAGADLGRHATSIRRGRGLGDLSKARRRR